MFPVSVVHGHVTVPAAIRGYMYIFYNRDSIRQAAATQELMSIHGVGMGCERSTGFAWKVEFLIVYQGRSEQVDAYICQRPLLFKRSRFPKGARN